MGWLKRLNDRRRCNDRRRFYCRLEDSIRCRYLFGRGLVATLAVLSGAIGFISGPVQAQGDASSYPTQSVKIIVPYPPGGGADFLARLLAEKAQARWAQTMIVENRSGTGGNVGTEFVFRASPDGYAMLITAQPPVVAKQ